MRGSACRGLVALAVVLAACGGSDIEEDRAAIADRADEVEALLPDDLPAQRATSDGECAAGLMGRRYEPRARVVIEVEVEQPRLSELFEELADALGPGRQSQSGDRWWGSDPDTSRDAGVYLEQRGWQDDEDEHLYISVARPC